MILQLLFQVMITICLSWQDGALAQSTALAKPNCTSFCVNVTIPFPFGIEKGCSMAGWFDISCNSSKPYITLSTNKTLEVLDISLDGTMRVNFPVCNLCNYSDYLRETVFFDDQDLSPFLFSESRNKFYGVGCGKFSFIANDDSVIAECSSTCDGNSNTRSENSCQAPVVSPFKRVYPIFEIDIKRGCNNVYAFLADQQWLETDLKNPQNVQNHTHVPVVLDWSVFKMSFDQHSKNKSREYELTSTCEMSACSCFSGLFPTVQCKCSHGYGGNPYLLEGCQDIDECKVNATVCKTSEVCENSVGSYNCIPLPAKSSSENSKLVVLLGIGAGLGGMFLLAAVWWLCILIRKRRDVKLKERNFKRNGGLLIQQQLTSSDGSIDRSKLFNSKDLEKATDHFNVNRILGKGGQGTVYKGMLEDGRIVAVKMSKATNEGKVDEFINEVVILSQINHRNVVKLLGFCLETEVPLLVYEFIPNGTLSQYLHNEIEELPFTWVMRLRIATEVAEALSYLHSSASIPIYHRDIKSTNILLDEKYRAKVADFGTSKSIAIDQTHVTTKVLGTFGYLDPEYFQSSQFTDKSDVYSFGVVLVELLTGQKPISSTRSEESRSLASYFILSMEGNNLFDILDTQVINQGKKEDIMRIANLAKRCLNLDGRRRPTMKEVAAELEAIFRASQNGGTFQQNYDGVEYVRTEVIEPWDTVSASTGSTFDTTPPSIEYVQPLLTKRSL